MNNDELRKFERRANAAMTAGLTALVLGGGGLGFMTSGLPGLVCVGCMVAVLGVIVGAAGTSARSLNWASFVGAAIFGIPVAVVILVSAIVSLYSSSLSGSLLVDIGESVWFLAAICSLGSVIAQVGAIAGGSTANINSPSQTRQFSLRQLLAFFIPVAVYFGYVSAHMRK
jgi:hypothetical protein